MIEMSLNFQALNTNVMETALKNSCFVAMIITQQ